MEAHGEEDRRGHMHLIRRTLAGDQDAFAELFDQYKNLVYRTAYLMLGDANEAEDALQEVFLQVYRSLASYRPDKGAFTTWLHRITVNHCLNCRRKRAALYLPLGEEGEREIDAPGRQIEERVADDEAVRAAMQKLSPDMRAAVVLRFYVGLSYAEMAEVLEVPIGTVQSRLNRAIGKMRQAIERASAPTRGGLMGAVREEVQK